MNMLDTKIDQLEMHSRTTNALELENIFTIRDLVKKAPAELVRLPNFGRKSLGEVREVLHGMNLSLAMSSEQIDYYDGVKPTDKICEDLNNTVREKAREALERSTKAIVSKNEWNNNELKDYFDHHEKILQTYKNSIQGYF